MFRKLKMSDSKKNSGIIDPPQSIGTVDTAAFCTNCSQAAADRIPHAERGPNLSAATAFAISAAAHPLLESSQQIICSTTSEFSLGAAANATSESSEAETIMCLQKMVRHLQKQLSRAQLQIVDEKKKSDKVKNHFLGVVENLLKRLELVEQEQCEARKEETVRFAKREEEETKRLASVIDGFATENDKWRKALVADNDKWKKAIVDQAKTSQEELTKHLALVAQCDAAEAQLMSERKQIKELLQDRRHEREQDTIRIIEREKTNREREKTNCVREETNCEVAKARETTNRHTVTAMSEKTNCVREKTNCEVAKAREETNRKTMETISLFALNSQIKCASAKPPPTENHFRTLAKRFEIENKRLESKLDIVQNEFRAALIKLSTEETKRFSLFKVALAEERDTFVADGKDARDAFLAEFDKNRADNKDARDAFFAEFDKNRADNKDARDAFLADGKDARDTFVGAMQGESEKFVGAMKSESEKFVGAMKSESDKTRNHTLELFKLSV